MTLTFKSIKNPPAEVLTSLRHGSERASAGILREDENHEFEDDDCNNELSLSIVRYGMCSGVCNCRLCHASRRRRYIEVGGRGSAHSQDAGLARNTTRQSVSSNTQTDRQPPTDGHFREATEARARSKAKIVVEFVTGPIARFLVAAANEMEKKK